jgi:AmmeMemoRadiSam system protein A
MAPSPSPERTSTSAHDAASERGTVVTSSEAALLLDLASTSIVDGLDGRPLRVPRVEDLPAELRREVGAFVTLTVDGALNGCIGTIEGAGPLGQEVVRLARSAAFADPRLPALRREDLAGLVIEVSILSPFELLDVGSRAQLVRALRPGTDGLVIAAGPHRAVFLPDVWDQLPDPDDFVDHLFRKGGLVPGTWPSNLAAHRFTTEHVERPFRPRA